MARTPEDKRSLVDSLTPQDKTALKKQWREANATGPFAIWSANLKQEESIRAKNKQAIR